ncbi:hypothetical protein JST97_17710 [bacterium]|nr:hypothetical protein [bacterium]
MADLSLGRISSGHGARPAVKPPSLPDPGPSEAYSGSLDQPVGRRYTVISLLATTLSNGVGAPTETREYLEKLAPQIADQSLAVAILGTYRVQEQNAWRSRRYLIDQRGVRDATAELSGFNLSDRGASTPARAEQVSALHPETLKNHIMDSMREFPAEHYIFHVSAHGSNVKGLGGCPNEQFSADDGEARLKHFSRFDRLDLPGLEKVLAEVQAESGQKMSIIDIDTCLMGYQEVNSALQHQADFIIASPAVEQGTPGDAARPARSGHQQVEVFEKILQNPQITPAELSREFIQVNAREGVVYENGQVSHVAPTLSAFSSQGIGQLNQQLDCLGARLLKDLKAPPERGLLGLFKKMRKPASQRIQNAIDQTRVFESSKGDPYLDLQHFAKNLAAQYPGDEEMLHLTEQVRQGVENSALASYKGVGEENGKLIDYSNWGPLGIFLPGARQNPFTQGLISHFRSTQASFSSDPISFWTRQKPDQLRLSQPELEQLEAIQKQASELRGLPVRQRVEAADGLPNFATPLARKIWSQEVSQRMPGLDEYQRTPNLPSRWKEFVQAWVDHQLESDSQ